MVVTEFLLVVVIALLTVNILFVGVYLVLVLKEVRAAIVKMNQILDSFSAISSAIAAPVSGAGEAISAITAGVKAFKKVKEIVKGEEKEEDQDEPAK